MAILSGHERQTKTVTDANGDHIRVSRWTHADTVELPNGLNLAESEVYLTQAEYDALGNEKYTNNVNYYITDATSEIPDSVVGVKGDAESAYRAGEVNITAENIGLGNVKSDILANANAITQLNSDSVKFIGSLTNGTDLNTLALGAYRCANTTDTFLNCPVTNKVFVIEVLGYAGASISRGIQRITTEGSNSTMYIRNLTAGNVWSNWEEIVLKRDLEKIGTTNKTTTPLSTSVEASVSTKIFSISATKGMYIVSTQIRGTTSLGNKGGIITVTVDNGAIHGCREVSCNNSGFVLAGGLTTVIEITSDSGTIASHLFTTDAQSGLHGNLSIIKIA